MNLQIEEFELELEVLKEKIAEIKELVDNLLYIWDRGVEIKGPIEELREVFDNLEI